MPRKSVFAGLAAMTLFMAAPVMAPTSLPLGAAPAQAQEASISFTVFFDKLTDGQWVENADYNYVFCPDVDADWAPYIHGHWIYLKNSGWYFESDEPYAWAVYHYGRWFQDADIGWCWVPGTVWAPAWVTWRRGDNYVGWAPLPPQGHGYSTSVKVTSTEVPEADWVFVPTKSFLQPRLATVVVLADQHPDVYRDTRELGPVVVKNNTVVNTVINIDVIEKQTSRKVQVVTPKRVDDPSQLNASAGGGQGGTVAVFQAKVQPPKQQAKPPHAVEAQQAAQNRRANGGQNAGAQPNAGNGNENAGAQPNGGEQPNANGQPNGAAPNANAPAGQAGAAGKSRAAKPNCAPDEMKNGVCPSKTGKPASRKDQSGAAAGPAQAAPKAAPKAGSQQEPSSKQAPASQPKAASGAKAGAPERKTTPAERGEKSQGGKFDTCPRGETMIDGHCTAKKQPGAKAPASERSAPAPQEKPASRGGDNGGAMRAAPPANDNGPAAGAPEKGAPAANTPKSSGGGREKAGPKTCPAGETMVNGVCAPPQGSRSPEGAGSSGNGGAEQGAGAQ